MWSQCRCVRRMAPANGRCSSRAETRRTPVPASSRRVGGDGPEPGTRRHRPTAPRRMCGPRNGRIRIPEPAWIHEYRRNGPAPDQYRAWSSRRCPSDSSCEIRSLESIGLDDRHPARGHRLERRRAGALLEVCPLSEEGARPVLGQALTVVLDPDHPVENEEDLVCPAHPAWRGCRRRGIVRSPPSSRPMTRAESERSNAVSTAVTKASESWSPQGVCRPNDWRYQSLKSVSPDLCERVPVPS